MPWGTLGMVGGSTHWAGMIAHPVEQIDFDHWRAETGVDWAWKSLFCLWPKCMKCGIPNRSRRPCSRLGCRYSERRRRCDWDVS